MNSEEIEKINSLLKSEVKDNKALGLTILFSYLGIDIEGPKIKMGACREPMPIKKNLVDLFLNYFLDGIYSVYIDGENFIIDRDIPSFKDCNGKYIDKCHELKIEIPLYKISRGLIEKISTYRFLELEKAPIKIKSFLNGIEYNFDNTNK